MTIKDIVLIALFAAFIAVLGIVPPIVLTFVPVPFVLQNMGIMFAGAFLGARRGFSACLLFLVLVAAGLPLLTGGRGGVGVFFGPSGGYLFGYPFAALAIGFLYDSFRNNLTATKQIIALIFGGVIISHAFGIIGMIFMGKIAPQAALLGDLVFVPGDCVKAVVTYFIVNNVKKALPNFME